MRLRILLPLLAVASLSMGGMVGLAAFAAPGDPPVSASPVEGDDAPVAAPAPKVDAGPATGIGTSPGPVDPTSDPAGSWAQLRAAWQGGGWLPALVLALYGAALLGRKYVPWLRKGRAAVVAAAVVAGLTAIATAVAAGEMPTPALLLNAAMTGLLLYLRPEQIGQVAPGSLGGGK